MFAQTYLIRVTLFRNTNLMNTLFLTHIKKTSPRNIYVYFIKFFFLINFYFCVGFFFWNQIFQILHGHLFNKLIDMAITPTSSHFQFNMHNQNLSALDITIQWYLSRISSLFLFISHELCRRYTMGHVKSPLSCFSAFWAQNNYLRKSTLSHCVSQYKGYPSVALGF